MSINWVMVAANTAEPFVKLTNEQILFQSPPRTTLDLATANGYPGHQPWSVKSDGGIAYVTSQRIVYIPTTPTPILQNFSCPILNLQDTYVRAPFFGANYWTAAVRPVNGGGIPPYIPVIELKMTFRDGGAFDFHSNFEQIKEKVYNAVQLAREEGRNVRAGGPLAGVDMANIHLDQLPAYEPSDQGPAPVSPQEPQVSRTSVPAADSQAGPRPTETFSAPNEPPPGYEEAQAQAVGDDLEGRLRSEADRQ